jgi:glycosyltransferase involved in cell wall biosynthesis
MMNPLVSVVMPSYNSGKFIYKTIKSVISQTYDNWELVIVDNNSNDNTIQIINSFQDKRIKTLTINNHGIIAASRNLGIKKSNGELIAFLDSDDLWYSSKLEVCVNHILDFKGFVCHSEIWSYRNDEIEVKRRKIHYGFNGKTSFNKLLFEGNCISTSAVVIHKKYLKKVGYFNESKSLVTVEDYHLWLKLLKEKIHVKFIPIVLGEFLIHGNNSSKTNDKNLNALSNAFELIYGNYQPKNLIIKAKAIRRRAIIIYSGARGFQSSGSFKKATILFFKAILRYPFVLKFYLALIMSLFKIK